MSAVVLNMPEEPEMLPGWLDRQLVGPDLPRLAAELAVLHGPPSAPTNLGTVLAGYRDSLLESGVSALPRSLLSQLLRQPELLLELQGDVFAEGGSYWDGLSEGTGDGAAERVRERVRDYVSHEPPRPEPARPAWYRRSIAVSLATAAAVAIAVFALRPPQSPAPAAGVAWGWASANGLPSAGDDAAVYRQLRDKAGEWFKKRPETPEALSQRLGEFRQGCGAIARPQDSAVPRRAGLAR